MNFQKTKKLIYDPKTMSKETEHEVLAPLLDNCLVVWLSSLKIRQNLLRKQSEQNFLDRAACETN